MDEMWGSTISDHGFGPCIHCIPSSQLPRLRPRATCRCHCYSTSHLAVSLAALSVSNSICSNDSSKSAAKYVSITLSSPGSTAMSAGKSSTTCQAGCRCFAALARTRRADCAGRSDGRKPARCRRPGERPTFWPRRDAVRLAGGKDGRARSDSGWLLPNLEAAIRLIISVRPWRRHLRIRGDATDPIWTTARW